MKTGYRLEPGDRVKFADERWRYTVQAVTTDRRYAICTRPFPLHKTVLYTVVDFREQVRGTDNLIFGRGYDTEDAIETSRDLFERGEVKVSRRNRVPLVIERVERSGATGLAAISGAGTAPHPAPNSTRPTHTDDTTEESK